MIFMNAKVIILSRTHKVRERERLSGVVATPVDGILQRMSC